MDTIHVGRTGRAEEVGQVRNFLLPDRDNRDQLSNAFVSPFISSAISLPRSDKFVFSLSFLLREEGFRQSTYGKQFLLFFHKRTRQFSRERERDTWIYVGGTLSRSCGCRLGPSVCNYYSFVISRYISGWRIMRGNFLK